MPTAMTSFADRHDAGRRLAQALRGRTAPKALVIALPRGGVPVAFEIAIALRAPLDILIVRKLGSPHSAEFGIGAIADGAPPQTVLNQEVLEYVAPPPGYLEAEIERQKREIRRRRDVYLEGRAPLPAQGREVIVVDDGIATGGTVRAALRALRHAGARHLVLAVPVASPSALAALRDDADTVICLHAPPDFKAVGQYYADFAQTRDEEVVRLLRKASDASTGGAT